MFDRYLFNRGRPKKDVNYIYDEIEINGKSSLISKHQRLVNANPLYMQGRGDLKAKITISAFSACQMAGISTLNESVIKTTVMFNKYLFNRCFFNRAKTKHKNKDIFETTTMAGKSTFKASHQKVLSTGEYDLNGISDLIAKITYESISVITLTGKSLLSDNINKVTQDNLYITGKSKVYINVLRVRNCKIRLRGAAFLYVDGTVVGVDEFELTGLGFKPGEVIVINLCDYYVTKNGINIMDKFNGDFFKFYPGDNILHWTDDQSARKIEIKILCQDKFI